MTMPGVDQLRFLLNLPRAEWVQPLSPVDSPRVQPLSTSFDQALASALERRPELQRQQIEIERAGLDVKLARANRLPSLDASVGYGLLGQRSQYADALEQLTSNDARVWSAGLSFRWTPLNESASAELAMRRLEQQARETELQAQRQALRLELRAALRALSTADRSLAAAAKFRDLAERSLDAEQRRFLNGTSDNFYVAQRQTDLAGARLAELAAVVAHQKATTALRAAMGVLLEDRNVVLDVAGAPGDPVLGGD